MAEEIGITFDEVFNEQLKGISRMDSLQRILKHGGKEGMFSDEQRPALATKKKRALRPVAGITDAGFAAAGYSRRAGGYSRREGQNWPRHPYRLMLLGILHALGIHQAFDFCADASRISRSKPDPEIFLAACKGLNVRPEEAIGIEDAAAGVDAINDAGMLSVGIGPRPEPCGITTSFNAGTDWERLTAFWASRAY